MKPSVRAAQRVCESIGARQVVVIAFDGTGQFACISYGETKAECKAVAVLCEAIGDALDEGLLPSPLPPK
jgi:hypothetical protein